MKGISRKIWNGCGEALIPLLLWLWLPFITRCYSLIYIYMNSTPELGASFSLLHKTLNIGKIYSAGERNVINIHIRVRYVSMAYGFSYLFPIQSASINIL